MNEINKQIDELQEKNHRQDVNKKEDLNIIIKEKIFKDITNSEKEIKDLENINVNLNKQIIELNKENNNKTKELSNKNKLILDLQNKNNIFK